MTAGLGLAVYGAAVAKSAFLGSAPVGIAAAVMAAVMSGEHTALRRMFQQVFAHASPVVRAALVHHNACFS